MSEQNPDTEPAPLENRIRRVSRLLSEFEGRLTAEAPSEPNDLAWLLDEARRTLKESEDRYQNLVNRSGAIVCELTPDGRLLALNDAVARVTGYRPGELIDQPWWERLFPGEFRCGLWRLYRRLRKGDVTGWELTLQNRHRAPVIVAVNSANAYRGNRLERITLFGIDITAERFAQRELERTREELQEKIWERTDALERINAELQIEIIEREQFENALRKSEERFRRAVDSIPGLVTLYDPGQRIRFVNRRALEFWELSEREVIGSTDRDLFPLSVTDSYLPVLRRTVRTRRPHSVEARVTLHGRAFTFLFNYVPLLDREGDVEEVLAIGYDVTERRRIEEDLRLRHRELQTLNRISEIALTRHSLPEAYREIVQAIREAAGFAAAVIETYDPEQGRLRCEAQEGAPSLGPERVPDETAGAVLRTHKPLVERRMEGASDLGPEFRTALCVPMVLQGEAIGLITIADTEAGEVDERMVQLLAATANYVAIMTDRHRAEAALRESEAQRERAEQFSLLMTVRIGLDGRWLRTTARLSEWLGFASEELQGRPVEEVVHPDDRQGLSQTLRQLQVAELPSAELELRFLARERPARWALMNISVIPSVEGHPLHFLAYLRDVTQQKKTEEELRLAAQVFESSAEAIMILDSDRRIVNTNRAFSEITGYARESVLGHTPRLLDSGRHSDDFFRQLWKCVEQSGQWQGEVWGKRRNGQTFPSLLNMGAVRDGRGRILNYVGIFRDITEIKRSQEQLERLANYDSLTQLPNRNLFNDRLRHGIDRARRAGTRLAILFIDLDNFKLINDTLGHDAGDELLKQVADRLRRTVRTEDTVARLGGDEFVVMLEQTDDVIDVADTARRINESLFIPVKLNGETVDITGSIGISVYPDDGVKTGSLLKNADTAMYVAKEEGRNKYRFFTGGMNEKSLERLKMEGALRQALEREEFFLVYQPQISVESGHPIGLEATIRWRHPELGVLSAERFIPVAEATGLIDGIGRWVLDRVCRQIRAWTDAEVPYRRVAVNISPRQFRQADIAAQIVASARRYGVAPADLEVELTEAALMRDPQHSQRTLEEMKAAGVRIAIDNFGTGYSSVSFLKRLPIDHLKIDESFVRDVTRDPEDAAISNAIIVMAHSLDVGVIAEGVETHEQLEFLASRGCDGMQGFLFSDPLPPEQLPMRH